MTHGIGNTGHIRFGARSALLVALCLGVFAPGGAVAQIACGDTVGPGQTVTLTGNVGPCDNLRAAITVDSGTLDLGGFTVLCADLDENGKSNLPYGVELAGKKAAVRNGTVTGCYHGVRVGGAEKSSVEGVTASSNAVDGFNVDGKKNKLSGNVSTGNGEDGIDLVPGADKNKITGNTISSNRDEGIDVSGNKNTLTGNTTTANGEDGIDVAAAAKKNKIMRNTATGNADRDLNNSGASCKANTWRTNTFVTSSASCIK